MNELSFSMDEIPSQSARTPNGPPRIDVEALCRLRRGGYAALHEISCEARGADLYLRGRLPTYYLKQMAQALVFELDCVRRVINLIEVSSNSSSGRPSPGHGEKRLAAEPAGVGH